MKKILGALRVLVIHAEETMSHALPDQLQIITMRCQRKGLSTLLIGRILVCKQIAHPRKVSPAPATSSIMQLSTIISYPRVHGVHMCVTCAKSCCKKLFRNGYQSNCDEFITNQTDARPSLQKSGFVSIWDILDDMILHRTLK